MIEYSLRVLKRFLVLVPGVVIAYLSVHDIFPYFDQRLPLGFAIFVTYILGAYILIPAIIRIVRALWPVKHLPLYCVTPDGFACDPLNIGIIGSRLQLIQAMEAAGWHVADPHNAKNMLKVGASALLEQPYPNAPVSSLYLFGRKQDIAFEIPLEGGFGRRHHVRFWATTYRPDQQLSVKAIHWKQRKGHISGDNLLWVGASSLDIGIRFIRHNLQLTHMVHPDTNAERELIVGNLKKVKLVKRVRLIKLGNPYRLVNRVWRAYLHTDGQMAVVELKH